MRQASPWYRPVTVPVMVPVTGIVLLALAGCARPPRPVPPPPEAAQGVRTGTILSARATLLHAGGVRRSVLAAIGARPQAARAALPAIEFIVREHDGTIISVIQPVPTTLRPGQPVRILPGPTTHIVPLAPRS